MNMAFNLIALAKIGTTYVLDKSPNFLYDYVLFYLFLSTILLFFHLDTFPDKIKNYFSFRIGVQF